MGGDPAFRGLQMLSELAETPFLTGAAIIILEILAIRAVLQPRQPTFNKTSARPNLVIQTPYRKPGIEILLV
jgi:hypothetical protein